MLSIFGVSIVLYFIKILSGSRNLQELEYAYLCFLPSLRNKREIGFTLTGMLCQVTQVG